MQKPIQLIIDQLLKTVDDAKINFGDMEDQAEGKVKGIITAKNCAEKTQAKMNWKLGQLKYLYDQSKETLIFKQRE
jgi:hypothetical protein